MSAAVFKKNTKICESRDNDVCYGPKTGKKQDIFLERLRSHKLSGWDGILTERMCDLMHLLHHLLAKAQHVRFASLSLHPF